MPRKPKASLELVRLLTANALGNVGKLLDRNAALKEQLDPALAEECIALASSASWPRNKTVKSSDDLRRLETAIRAFESLASDEGWIETAEISQLVSNSVKEFVAGGVLETAVEPWRMEAKIFEQFARDGFLYEGVAKIAWLIKHAQIFQKTCDHRVKSSDSIESPTSKFDSSAPLEQQTKLVQTAISDVHSFLSEHSDFEGKSAVTIMKAMRLEKFRVGTQNLNRAIKWLAKHPNEIHCPASSSTSTAPSPAAPHRTS